MIDISSSQNERVKLVRALQSQTKARRKEGKIVVEGVRLLGDALDCGLVPLFAFYTEQEAEGAGPVAQLVERMQGAGVLCLSVTPAVMKEVSDVETSPGVLAVLPRPDVPAPSAPILVLALDSMNNPGNLGSALRTASASGVDLIVLTPGTVDPFNPKALRGGMGAQFRLPIVAMTWEGLAEQYGQLGCYVADAGGDKVYFDVDWRTPSLVIIGGEAHGPGQQAREMADAIISIPMAAATESLNASVAAGIILYEARRQRIIAQR